MEKLRLMELGDCETWCLKKIGLPGPVHVSSYQRLEAKSKNQSYQIPKLKYSQRDFDKKEYLKREREIQFVLIKAEHDDAGNKYHSNCDNSVSNMLL